MKPTVATIGVFDGVHLGHRFLLDRTVQEAAAIGGRAVAFTFDPHPAAVLAPDKAPFLLTPTVEKVPLLEETGLDEVVVLRFDREISNLSPEEFLDRHILPGHRLEHLVVGHDFALGKNRAGDADRLARVGGERGFRLTHLGVLRVEGVVVSSTRIREAITRGDLVEAERLLGRPYAATGPVTTGEGRGRSLGFPTANVVVPPSKLMPPFGVYAAWAVLDPRKSGGAVHPAVMNYGVRPTFQGTTASLEVHLLGFTGDLVGRVLEVRLVERIRGERRFSGVAELVDQIRRDAGTARRRLEVGPE